jgi:hypothetical protein
MGKFSDWYESKSALEGYVLASLGGAICSFPELLDEGRKDPGKLRQVDSWDKHFKQLNIFPNADVIRPDQSGPKSCPITPLSGYDKHIKSIQRYAHSGPDQFAQTLLFSPLSANVPFAKHWDNFHVLMLVLKHYFYDHVDRNDLERVLDAFGDYLHSMQHTIGGWKLDTITYVWNQRHELFSQLNKLAAEGDDVKLIARLTQVPGVQPVKAGFIVQLLWGRAGCIDTHNIDIYTKVFPDLKQDFDPKQWGAANIDPDDKRFDRLDKKRHQSIGKYVDLLGKLDQKGIGTKQLWDVWVDFVENFYKMVSSHGKGLYGDMGSSLNPDDPMYKIMQGITIPKKKVGKQKGFGNVDVPLVSGQHGMGASATHIQVDPDEMLKKFHRMYDLKQPGGEAERSVPFHVDKMGRPLDALSGMGREPSALHYFRPAITGSDVDPGAVRRIIGDKIEKGGRKARAARAAAEQPDLFA